MHMMSMRKKGVTVECEFRTTGSLAVIIQAHICSMRSEAASLSADLLTAMAGVSPVNVFGAMMEVRIRLGSVESKDGGKKYQTTL